MRENRSLGSVRGGVGNDLAYSAGQMDQPLLAHHIHAATLMTTPDEAWILAMGPLARRSIVSSRTRCP